MKLYKPFKSRSKAKKFSVYVLKDGKPTLIHFGQKGYRHNYSKEAREAYDKRSRAIRDNKGNLTYKDINTANYWARTFLWDL